MVPQGGGNAPVVHGATLTGKSWETTLHRAHAAQPVSGSSEYSMLWRGPEDGDIRKVESRFSPEHLPHNLALVTCWTTSANQIRFTPSELAELHRPLPRLKATSGSVML